MAVIIEDISEFDSTFDALLDVLPPGAGLITIPGPASTEEFEAFCIRHPKVKAELTPDKTIEVMSPLVARSGKNEGILFAKLFQWWELVETGEVFNSSVAFTLPSGAVRAPDAAWVNQKASDKFDNAAWESFPSVVPDFIAEVRSKSDKRSRLEAKMVDTWMDAGVRLAWLIDPIAKEAIVYRQGQAPERISDFSATLEGEDVLEGFGFELALLG